MKRRKLNRRASSRFPSKWSGRTGTVATRTKRSLRLELLENRITPAPVTLQGIPDWIEEGPGPIAVSGNPVQEAGNINAIAVNPSKPNVVFVATANGGIWRSLNATNSPSDGINNDNDGNSDEATEIPTWTPLTDQQQNLSMSEVAFDPNDASGNTWYAGFGRVSNGFGDGISNQGGLLRTTDNGNTWKLVDTTQ